MFSPLNSQKVNDWNACHSWLSQNQEELVSMTVDSWLSKRQLKHKSTLSVEDTKTLNTNLIIQMKWVVVSLGAHHVVALDLNKFKLFPFSSSLSDLYSSENEVYRDCFVVMQNILSTATHVSLNPRQVDIIKSLLVQLFVSHNKCILDTRSS